MNIFPFIAWLVLTVIWAVLNWLTYKQIQQVLSLRPVAKYVFYIQLSLSIGFLLISLATIVGFGPSSTTTTTPSTPNGIY